MQGLAWGSQPGRSGAWTRWLVTGALAFSGWLTWGAAAAQAQDEAAPPAGVTGYVRVDTDKLGTAVWFGATHRYHGTDIASDVYLLGSTAELDIGPVYAIGENVAVSPMAGVVLDMAAGSVATFVPQFYIYVTAGRWYLESWETGYLAASKQYRPHYFYDRTFLLCSLGDALAIGPQAEMQLSLEDTAPDSRLTSLALGGVAQVGYGESNTLLLSAGYEARKEARGDGDGIAGRVTFIREW